MGTLDGRVAIITGAGRGIGREHALLFAAEGAKVVVNDLGGAADGTGQDVSPAQQVVDEIEAMGGEAVANGDNVAELGGWPTTDQRRDRGVRRSRHPREQRRHPARPGARQHDRGGVGRRRRRPPEGPLRAEPVGGGVLARADQGRRREAPEHGPHVVDVGAVLQPGPDQLRRRQVGHRHVQPDRREGAGALRREVELHRTGGAHPPHRGDAGPGRHRQGARGGETSSTSGTRPTSRRSSPTSPPPTAPSPARRSSCRAARSSGSSRGSSARASSATTAGRSASWPPP